MKTISLLFVSLVVMLGTGCHHVRNITNTRPWEGAPMHVTSPDYKPSQHYDVPAKVMGGDRRFMVNSGYGYNMNASLTESLSLYVTPSYDYGLPRVDFSRSINNSFYERESYTPVPPNMITVPTHNYNASGYVPLIPRRR